MTRPRSPVRLRSVVIAARAPRVGRVERLVRRHLSGTIAAEVMQTYHEKARKLGRNVDELVPALHKLRIRLKRLDFAAEFFGGLWPNQHLTTLRHVEDALGVFHHTAVADGIVARFMAIVGADAKLSAGPVSRWLTNYLRHRRREAIETWRKFANQKPFWDALTVRA